MDLYHYIRLDDPHTVEICIKIIYAFLAGLAPAIIWLMFWLREDAHPEPQGVIARVFIIGACMVPFAYIMQSKILDYQGGNENLITVAAWALVEEFLKLFAAYIGALRSRHYAEPIDAVMYLITASLGFAAIENMLFILEPVMQGHVLKTISVVNIRFVGAMLLHIISSAIIGLALAETFFKNKWQQILAGFVAIICATSLHTFFNYLIINSEVSKMLLAFITVWIGIIAVIFILEKIKRIKQIS